MYVLVTIEDDGWASQTEIQGVYSTFELARENFEKTLTRFMEDYDVKGKEELEDLQLDFAAYYDSQGTWFKVYFDNICLDKEVYV